MDGFDEFSIEIVSLLLELDKKRQKIILMEFCQLILLAYIIYKTFKRGTSVLIMQTSLNNGKELFSIPMVK